MISLIFQFCILLLLAILLVMFLVSLEEVRFGFMAAKELVKFRQQIREDIQEALENIHVQVTINVEETPDNADWWKQT